MEFGMVPVNSKAKRLKPSETLVIKARATELKAQGKSIVDMSVGEPDIETPQHIKDAAVKALAEGKTRYTHAQGIIELRQAIKAKLERENGLSYDVNNIIVSNGGKQALYTCIDVLVEAGDEVILPVPYWVSYLPMIEMAGAKAVLVQTKAENGFKLTPAELKAAITPKTKLFIINSPSNPVGLGYTESEMAALGKVLEPTQVAVLSDEIYEKICFNGFKSVSFAKACPALFDRTITVNGFAKTYAMTGWRVGYAAGPREVIDAMAKHQSQATSSINTVAQWASVVAMNGPQDFLKPVVENYDRRVRAACALLAEAPGLSVPSIPVGAFYVWCSFAELKAKLKSEQVASSQAFARYLLEKGGVAVVPGEAFGDDSAFRISVASPDSEVKSGCERIVAAVQALLA